MTDLVYATAHNLTTLEPTQVSGFADHTAALAIFGSLVMNFDGHTGNVGYFPWLAKRVEPRGDSAWEIELWPELRFHDGTPLNAAALKFSFERIQAPDFPSQRYLHSAPIDYLEVTGPLTLVVHTRKPIAIFMARLFRADGSPVAPSQYSANPTATAFNPVGAGPFRFVEHQKNDRLILEVNRDFPDPRGYAPPNFDRLVLCEISDPRQLLKEMAAGKVDIAPITPILIKSVEALEGWRVVSGPDTSRMTLEINQKAHPALGDKRVRHAINHAIDIDTLCKELTGGAGNRITTLVNPPNADKSIIPYAYDPARAKALLAEAGFAKGFKMSIDWSTGPDRGLVANAVVPYLEAIGIEIEAVRERDWGEHYLPGQTAGTLAGLHGHGHAGVEMTAETDLWPIHPERDANSTNWTGPAADKFIDLYSQLQQETDLILQGELGRSLQAIAHEQAISVPFWQLPRYVAVSAKIEHFLPYPGGHNEDFWTIRMVEGAGKRDD